MKSLQILSHSGSSKSYHKSKSLTENLMATKLLNIIELVQDDIEHR